MTVPIGDAPEGAYVVGTVAENQDWDDPSIRAHIRGKALPGFEAAQTNWLARLVGNIGSAIGDVIGNIVGAITGGTGFDLGFLSSFMGNLTGQVDTVSNEIITISADQVTANERLTDLESISGTGVVTPIWSSAGGKDIVAFPRVLMQPRPISSTHSGSTNTEANHRHSMSDGASNTGFDGSHNHTFNSTINITYSPPAFTQTHGIPDFVFLRGGLSTETLANVVKIITGADASIFDINAWYLGAYAYNGSGMVKFWDSGNIKSVLSGQRQGYNIGTGLSSSVIQPDHLIAIASLQLADGFLQTPRGIGCIFQTNISEAAGTVPSAAHATLLNPLSALPDWVDMTWFQWKRDKIMWAAIGESS